jgi:hypothetical protein
LVMLRPAVAARNCAKPGETSRLDIRSRCLSLEKTDPARAVPVRQGCPGEGGPSTRLAQQIISGLCGGRCGRDPLPEPGPFLEAGRISGGERAYSRTKRRFLVIYQQVERVL